MPDDDRDRLDVFRSASICRPRVKELIAKTVADETSSSKPMKVSDEMAIVVSGSAKLFVAELCHLAKR